MKRSLVPLSFTLEGKKKKKRVEKEEEKEEEEVWDGDEDVVITAVKGNRKGTDDALIITAVKRGEEDGLSFSGRGIPSKKRKISL
jgi:hypothetical protein